jgi:hypothetical protein
MKALRILFVVSLLAPVRFLHAQIEDRPLMSVNIPFAFTVENVRLPAGRYVVSMVELNRLWRLSSADHKTNTLLHISANEDPGLAQQSKLIFRHYETDYVPARNYGATERNCRYASDRQTRAAARTDQSSSGDCDDRGAIRMTALRNKEGTDCLGALA